MKPYIFLIMFAPFSGAETMHNDQNEQFWLSMINQKLRSDGIYYECKSTQLGRYIADATGGKPPEGWTINCKKNLKVEWDHADVNGEAAAVYRVVYMVTTSNVKELFTTKNSVTLEIVDPTDYIFYIEAQDSDGNGVYLDYQFK